VQFDSFVAYSNSHHTAKLLIEQKRKTQNYFQAISKLTIMK